MSRKLPLLKPAAFYILLVLAERDRHGYATMQAVAVTSGDAVTLNTASFYRHLGTLLDAGLIVRTARRPKDDDPRRGAYYRITAEGRAALVAERHRLAGLLDAVDGLRLAAGRPRR